MARRAADALGVLRRRFKFRGGKVFFEDFAVAEDGVQRRAQFVADIGEKLGLGRVGLFGLLERGDQKAVPFPKIAQHFFETAQNALQPDGSGRRGLRAGRPFLDGRRDLGCVQLPANPVQFVGAVGEHGGDRIDGGFDGVDHHQPTACIGRYHGGADCDAVAIILDAADMLEPIGAAGLGHAVLKFEMSVIVARHRERRDAIGNVGAGFLGGERP